MSIVTRNAWQFGEFRKLTKPREWTQKVSYMLEMELFELSGFFPNGQYDILTTGHPTYYNEHISLVISNFTHAQ
jgi:hypothetical protein